MSFKNNSKLFVGLSLCAVGSPLVFMSGANAAPTPAASSSPSAMDSVSPSSPAATMSKASASPSASPSLVSELKNEPIKAVSVVVKSDGTEKTHFVPEGSTIGYVFAKSGITVTPLDKTSAKLDSVVKQDQKIEVTRNEATTFMSKEILKFSTITQKDTVDCADGESSKTIRKGKNGFVNRTYSLKLVNSKPTKATVVNTDKTDAVNEIIALCNVSVVAPIPTAEATIDESFNSPSPSVNSPSINPQKGSQNISTPTVTRTSTTHVTRQPASNNSNNLNKSSKTTSNTPKETKTKNVYVSGSKQDLMTQAGIAESDWAATNYIINRESSWRVNATNPSSGAYGLPQSLPGTKMASAGSDWRTNPVTQLKWFKSYCTERYGSISGAYQFWLSNHWY